MIACSMKWAGVSVCSPVTALSVINIVRTHQMKPIMTLAQPSEQIFFSEKSVSVDLLYCKSKQHTYLHHSPFLSLSNECSQVLQ